MVQTMLMEATRRTVHWVADCFQSFIFGKGKTVVYEDRGMTQEWEGNLWGWRTWFSVAPIF